MRRDQRGFTLVEIMIVVAIIALLAGLAIPNFIEARRVAQCKTCNNNLRIIDGAKQQYALEYGVADTATPTTANISPYIKNSTFPSCPGGGSYAINAVNTVPTCTLTTGVSTTALKCHTL